MIGRGKALAKRMICGVCGSDVLLRQRVREIAATGVLTILNFHRVDDGACSAMKPALFEDLIRWLKRQFHIVTFAELQALPDEHLPPLILSFDDGYKDFIEVVAPILKKHGVRANQNVIPGCVESGRPPLNVMLQDFIATAPAALLREAEFPGLPDGADPSDRVRSGQLASMALKSRPMTEQKTLFADLEKQFARYDQFQPTPVMNIDEVRQIAGEHEIGAHSWEHATMAAESDAYLAQDAARCRQWFRERVGMEPWIYAFPNGATRGGQPQSVQEGGFPCVLSVGERFSRPDAWLHYRFTIYASTPAEARFRAAGGFMRPAA
jgi:peptidoglycan/xylan/chitin deacetylase (PgdA/CDA1 family)